MVVVVGVLMEWVSCDGGCVWFYAVLVVVLKILGVVDDSVVYVCFFVFFIKYIVV